MLGIKATDTVTAVINAVKWKAWPVSVRLQQGGSNEPKGVMSQTMVLQGRMT